MSVGFLRKVSLAPHTVQAGSILTPAPASSQALDAALMMTELSRQKQAKGPLIAVVDDSPTVRKIVETVLEREGYEVLCFADGVELWYWLVGPEARPPAVLILDVGLPKIDGYELALRVKKKSLFAQTVILMLTRRDGMLDRLKGYLAGAKVYMTKPMKTQDLLAAVAFCLGRGSYPQ